MPIFLPVRPGIYRHPNGGIVRVRLNKNRTNVYTETWRQARTLDGDLIVPTEYRFDFDPSKLAGLAAEHRIPLDEARRISREVGQCLACAKLLTDPKSQAAGIGPTCAKTWTYDQAVNGIVFDATPEQIAAAREQEAAARQRSREAKARASVRARLVGDRIVLTSEFDHRIVSIIRTFDEARWDGEAWTLPRGHATALAEAFELVGIAHEDLALIGMGLAP